MSAGAPSPNDYAHVADWQAAYTAWMASAPLDANQVELLAVMESTGGRTTPCACGYTPFDSCPVCDR